VPLNPDVSIQNQFDDIKFDELDLIIALIKFEIDELVEIPDEFCDYRITFRQLAEAITLLPKIQKVSADEFRTQKWKMLSDMGEKLRRELGRIQKEQKIS
jgi:hypothetical protein